MRELPRGARAAAAEQRQQTQAWEARQPTHPKGHGVGCPPHHHRPEPLRGAHPTGRRQRGEKPRGTPTGAVQGQPPGHYGLTAAWPRCQGRSEVESAAALDQWGCRDSLSRRWPGLHGLTHCVECLASQRARLTALRKRRGSPGLAVAFRADVGLGWVRKGHGWASRGDALTRQSHRTVVISLLCRDSSLGTKSL